MSASRFPATVVTPPTEMPYHVLEFSVRDLDGHVLGFGQPTSGGSTDA